jgi:hypothetical protein
MSTTEHLQKIRARCAKLLEIASKRTPGKWEPSGDTGMVFCDDDCIADLIDGEISINATFIASCAGAAESGWRATIVAIDFLLRKKPSPAASFGFTRSEISAINEIIAAWPEELL